MGQMAPSASLQLLQLGGAVDRPEGCAVLHRNLNMEKWTDGDFMKFNKGKWKVLHLGKNYPRHPYWLGSYQLKISFAEKAQVECGV